MTNKHDLLPHLPLRIAAAQAQPIRGNIEENVNKVVELIDAAADDNVQLIVFPEKFLSGYEPDLILSNPLKYSIAKHDNRLTPIIEVCQKRNIIAIVGAATSDAGKLFITSLVFSSKEGLVTYYHKQYLFSGEAGIYSSGDTDCILEVNGWKLALAVCYDSGFPEHARLAAMNGCHAYLVSALFSVEVGYHESRVWMPARALDNTIYVLMSNHIGKTGGWNACGSSGIWDPFGNLLAEASVDIQSILSVDLDPAALHNIRARETMLADLLKRTQVQSSKCSFYHLT